MEAMWRVANTSHESTIDVTPTSGILRFGNLDYQKSFQLQVIDDDVPELTKVVLLQLEIISGRSIQ